jgi:hypothetical protein
MQPIHYVFIVLAIAALGAVLVGGTFAALLVALLSGVAKA